MKKEPTWIFNALVILLTAGVMCLGYMAALIVASGLQP